MVIVGPTSDVAVSRSIARCSAKITCIKREQKERFIEARERTPTREQKEALKSARVGAKRMVEAGEVFLRVVVLSLLYCRVDYSEYRYALTSSLIHLIGAQLD